MTHLNSLHRFPGDSSQVPKYWEHWYQRNLQVGMLRETEDRLGYRPEEYVVLHCHWRMDWWMRKGAEHLVFLGLEGEPRKDLDKVSMAIILRQAYYMQGVSPHLGFLFI